MAEGFHDFASAEVLTAANTDDYLMRQTVMRFADASARDTALSGILTEGLVAYLKDTNTITMYTGAAWVAVGTIGAWTAYTATVTGWTLGNGTAVGAYQKIGRMVTYRGVLQTGTTTIFTGNLALSLPFTSCSSRQSFFGGGLFDISGGVYAPAFWSVDASATTVIPYAMTAINQINTAGLEAAIPFNWQEPDDRVEWSFTYEAAS